MGGQWSWDKKAEQGLLTSLQRISKTSFHLLGKPPLLYFEVLLKRTQNWEAYSLSSGLYSTPSDLG